jgi:hypothetical protein
MASIDKALALVDSWLERSAAAARPAPAPAPAGASAARRCPERR